MYTYMHTYIHLYIYTQTRKQVYKLKHRTKCSKSRTLVMGLGFKAHGLVAEVAFTGLLSNQGEKSINFLFHNGSL